MRLVPVLLTLLACACTSPAQRREDFGNAVRMYNEGVRWQRWGHAASYIPPPERADFVDERADLEEELRIDDFEVLRQDLQAAGDRATVRVRYTWHLDREGVVHETTASQEWERRGKRWYMVEERRVRGPEMPGLAEPLPDPVAERGEGPDRRDR